MNHCTLSEVSHALISSRALQWLRRMLGLLIVCLGLCATSSHAQDCASRVINRTKETRVTIPFNTANVSSETTLDTGSVTVTYTNCSGYNNTTISWNMRIPNLFAAANPNVVSFNGSNAELRIFAVCRLGGNCFDSSGQSHVRSVDIPQDGISMNLRLTLSGQDSQGKNCINITGANPPSGNIGPSWTVTSVATGCVTFTTQIDVAYKQNALFKPGIAGVDIVRLGYQAAIIGTSMISFYGNVISCQPLPTNAVCLSSPIVGLNTSSQAFFVAQPTTCALSLSNTFINFGILTPTQVSNTPAGATVISKPLTVNIGNCPAGFATGKNKILQWAFANPNTDRTRMENAMGVNGGTGVSAQIQADQRFNVTNPTIVLPNIVTSGESYITSGTTSNNQSLNYQVNIIRNSDPVVPGGFSSTATVTLSYK